MCGGVLVGGCNIADRLYLGDVERGMDSQGSRQGEPDGGLVDDTLNGEWTNEPKRQFSGEIFKVDISC